ncbi:MAG TPA: SDR family NAD(P)-dependent oxidoreductase [Candidatus Sulfotelmatobacter sp.]|nr:SDR family NAD(P)-dependent oxidoreductase [Candidatus Sulfotelmatobacter sp.]
MNVALITGASSGIGNALVLLAARAGYQVVAIGRNQIALTTLANRVRAEGGEIEVGAFDLADPHSAAAVVALAHRAFGPIELLVANAGAAAVGELSAQSDAALQGQFGLHVIGPVALVREALPDLQARGGHVFLVGSGVARVPIGGMGAYPPSKAALRSAATIVRRELRPRGVAVTYVDPGAVDTAFMTRAGMPGAPPRMLVAPETVARKMLLAVRTRPRELNVAPWQTMAVALAASFPRLTDLLLERMPALTGTQAATTPTVAASTSEALPQPTPPAPEEQPAEPFDAALDPVRRRMERVRMGEPFVRGLLRADAVLDPHEVALAWAGMPNKNERAATVEVLEALADAGFLAREGEHYRVLRAAPD